MTSLRLHVYFTTTVVFLILLYYLILSNLPIHPVLLSRHQRQDSQAQDAGVPDDVGEYMESGSNPADRMQAVNQSLVRDVRNFKSHLVSRLTLLSQQPREQEQEFASLIVMHSNQPLVRQGSPQDWKLEVGSGGGGAGRGGRSGKGNKSNLVSSGRMLRSFVCNNMSFLAMDPTFPGIVQHGVYRVLPARKLHLQIQDLVPQHLQHKEKPTCALVSSAASLIGSGSGDDIDAHHIVLRFNAATTDAGMQRDTGARTSIRLLNSHFFASDDFNVSDARLSQQVLLVWDNFTAAYEPDAGLLYRKYVYYRDTFPDLKIFILNPDAVRQAAQVLARVQGHKYSTPKPSSGFIGFLFLTRFCSSVTAYELIPSVRMTSRCRYYDSNGGYECTFAGDRASEKLAALRMTHSSDRDVLVGGRARFLGCVT